MIRVKVILLCLYLIPGVSHAGATHVQNMREFIWVNRVLITEVHDVSALERIKQTIARNAQQFSDNKLISLVKLDANLYSIQIHGNKLTSTQLTQNELVKEIKELLTEFSGNVLLVGLDGRVKHKYKNIDFKLADAFNDISLMPMRRAELNNLN